MSRVFWKTQLALCLAILASCGGSDLEPRYVAVHNTLTSMGLAQSGPINRASLDEGEELRVPVELRAGACYSVVALGARGVDDLGLRVVDARNEAVAEDRSTDREAAVQVCPARTGAHELVVTMSSGSGAFSLSLWEGGHPSGRGAAGVLGGAGGGDACAAVEDLSPGRLVQGDTSGGGRSMSPPCAGGSAPERVFRLEVERPSQVTVNVESRFDAVVYVLRSCGQVDTTVACNDDYQDVNHARATFSAEPGEYFVVVDGYGDASGAFDLSVDVQPLRPIAEVCADAPVLTAGASVTESTEGLPNYFTATCAAGATGGDRVFRLPVPQRSRVRVRQRSQFDGVLHLRSSCEQPGSELACNDDVGNTTTSLLTAVLDEGDYFVVSDGYGVASGEFTLVADLAPPAGGGAPSDSCADAGRLAPGTTVDLDTFQAADDFTASCGGAGAPDIVQRVEVRTRSSLRVLLRETEFNAVVSLRRACADEGAELACAVSQAGMVRPDRQAALDAVVDPGTYYVIVDGLSPDAFGATKAQVELSDLVALERDCRRAPLLRAGRTVNGSTSGQPSRFDASCAGNAQSGDAVYRIRVRQRQRVVIDLTASYDAALHLRSSCVDRSTELGCNDDHTSQTSSHLEAELAPGTYYVIVDGFAAGNTGDYSLVYQATNL